jgi:hypothetical protein
MFDTIENVVDYYKTGPADKNKVVYQEFDKAATADEGLKAIYDKADGYGELAFSWNWKLLIDSVGTSGSFKFLEIGVYKGRVMSQVAYLAKRAGKQVSTYGVTPLSTAGDKYSVYQASNFLSDIWNNYLMAGGSITDLRIIEGYSQKPNVIERVQQEGPFDIVFIDGSHDYDDVVADLRNYGAMVKAGGYLVMDDASLYVPGAYGRFLGHPDVSRAAGDVMDKMEEFTHLYAIGHDRVWRKNAIAASQ